MINKERLQQLIKQGATIYWISSGYLYPDREKIRALKLNKNFCLKDKNVGCCLVEIINGRDDIHLTINCYYETKEDAHWSLEMTATRIEILSLPNYKVAKTYIDTDKFILEDNSKFKFLLLSNPDNIIIVDKQHGNQIFNKPLTKDNYIEACKLCLKLFKGESSRS